MPVTAQLVYQGHNNLRYLITNTDEGGGSVTIPNDGGATPDLQTDTLAGPLKQIARARIDGLGTIPAGTPLSQGQARSALLAGATTPLNSLGGTIVPRARCFVTGRSVAAMEVDADVDGEGDPVLIVTMPPGVGYLDIEMIGGIAQ